MTDDKLIRCSKGHLTPDPGQWPAGTRILPCGCVLETASVEARREAGVDELMWYHELRHRNHIQANRLEGELLPEARMFTHAHVHVGAGMVQLLCFRRDPVTKKREFERIAIPYDHFLLVARGIVDAHLAEEPVRRNDAEFGE